MIVKNSEWGSPHADGGEVPYHVARAMETEEDDRRSRLRRLQDLMTALDGLGDDEMPPLPILFRLSELGVKDPAAQKVPVLRRRVLAIYRLYQERLPENRRSVLRRGTDRPLELDEADGTAR